MVLEEVKSLGHPKIGPAPLQGHSLSNFEGSRPPSGAGIPWPKQEVLGWLALLVERTSPWLSQVLPSAESGGRRRDSGLGPMGEAGGLGSWGGGLFGSLRSTYWNGSFCPPGGSWFPVPQKTQLEVLRLRLFPALAFLIPTPSLPGPNHKHPPPGVVRSPSRTQGLSSSLTPFPSPGRDLPVLRKGETEVHVKWRGCAWAGWVKSSSCFLVCGVLSPWLFLEPKGWAA